MNWLLELAVTRKDFQERTGTFAFIQNHFNQEK